MIVLSAILILIFVLYFLLRNSINKGIEINHITTFSVGWIYYWLLPIILYRLNTFESMNVPFKEDISRLAIFTSDKTIYIYYIFILLIYISFIAGDYYGRKHFLPSEYVKVYLSDKHILYLSNIILLPIVVYFTYEFRDYFFSGYTIIDWYKASQKGQFVSLSLLLFVIYLFYIVNKYYARSFSTEKALIRNLFFNYFFILYMFVSIYIVSMGGRLYFVSTIIMLLVFYSVYIKEISYPVFTRFFFLMFSAIILVGVWRNSGQLNIDFNSIFSAIFAESVLVGISLFTFIQDDFYYLLLNKPIFLGMDFINIVPRFILPDKGAYSLSFSDYGYNIYSPAGALNSFLSFMINFGIIGSIVVFFMLGYFLRWLRNSSVISGRISYIFISGILMFSIFRDPFSISIVKLFFQFGLLIPIILFMIIKFYSLLSLKKNKKNAIKKIQIK